MRALNKRDHHAVLPLQPKTCDDPVELCSGFMMRRETREYDDGRICKEMDGAAQKRTGSGHYSGQDDGFQGHPAVRPVPSEIEEWVDQGKAGMEDALRAKPEDIREQYERDLKDLQEAYGEAMLGLRAQKKSSGLKQKFITPHCPQQNGMIERIIRTLKEQCVHRHRFESIQHASRAIEDWIHFYNNRRPHQALGMKTPAEAFRLTA